MVLTAILRRLAAHAPVPVFAVAGTGRRDALTRLRLDPRVQLVDSPRHASILLLAGPLPDGLVGPARQIHDQLPIPRATLWWPGSASARAPEGFGAVAVVHDDVVAALVACRAELVDGRRPSDPDLLPDVDPAPWRGVGPYGQGGKGMTGGVPYGRPMAGRAPDRDGLELDQLAITVGPLFPPLPCGLALHVALQGDIVQQARVEANPFADGAPPAPDRFRDALGQPARIADLELARARHHLRWAAEALRVAGLAPLGLRVLAWAEAVVPADAEPVRALGRRIMRNVALRYAIRGVGVIDGAALDGLGPVARAAGRADDARTDDPQYRGLGFEPVVHARGDVAARWEQRFAEAAQSLDLAGRAGDRLAAGDAVESPHGRLAAGVAAPSARLVDLLPSVLEGLEWGDAVATIVSLDLDLEAAAASQAVEAVA